MSAHRALMASAFLVCLCPNLGIAEPPAGDKVSQAASSPRGSVYQTPFPTLRADRRQAIEELIAMLETLPPGVTAADPINTNEILDAIGFLGEYRAAEAAKPLAKRLAFFPRGGNVVYDDEATTIIQFPAASALIEIGRPAVPDLLRIIEGRSTEFERRLAVLTLLQIERIPSDDFETPEDDLAKERLILLFEQRKRSVPATAKAYDWAIDYLKGYQEQHKPPYEIPGFFPEEMWKTGWLKDYKDYKEQEEKKRQAQDKTVKTPESSSDEGQQRNP